VAHQEDVYIYNLMNGNWINNCIPLESNVKFILSYRDADRVHNIMILLEDSSIVVLKNNDPKYYDPN
jgi:hypothetical protein